MEGVSRLSGYHTNTRPSWRGKPRERPQTSGACRGCRPAIASLKLFNLSQLPVRSPRVARFTLPNRRSSADPSRSADHPVVKPATWGFEASARTGFWQIGPESNSPCTGPSGRSSSSPPSFLSVECGYWSPHCRNRIHQELACRSRSRRRCWKSRHRRSNWKGWCR